MGRRMSSEKSFVPPWYNGAACSRAITGRPLPPRIPKASWF